MNARAEGASLAAGIELVHREARLLDERRWDEWLALFVEDCEYWMPAWKADGTPTTNPQAELSHIYYASRAGLEDRVVRIRSGKSPASAWARSCRRRRRLRLRWPPARQKSSTPSPARRRC